MLLQVFNRYCILKYQSDTNLLILYTFLYKNKNVYVIQWYKNASNIFMLLILQLK